MRRLCLCFAAIWLASRAAHAAALAIVLALDVSASVSADSFILQRDGIAQAFADSGVIAALAAHPGGIEALILEWSDPDNIAVPVNWTWISDARSAAGFAAAVHGIARGSRGLTAIGPALAAAAAQFERLPELAERHVIDISGDGIANLGEPPQLVRDRLVSGGITINGLALSTELPWLADYYRRNVIGGPGAFVVAVREFRGFGEAMRRKLTAEIAGVTAPERAQMQ